MTDEELLVKFEELFAIADERSLFGNSCEETMLGEYCYVCSFMTLVQSKRMNIDYTIIDWLDDAIEYWHESNENDVPLHTHLGMSWEEYKSFGQFQIIPDHIRKAFNERS